MQILKESFLLEGFRDHSSLSLSPSSSTALSGSSAPLSGRQNFGRGPHGGRLVDVEHEGPHGGRLVDVDVEHEGALLASSLAAVLLWPALWLEATPSRLLFFPLGAALRIA